MRMFNFFKIILAFVDTEEEKKERRKPSYKTNIVIQGCEPK